MLSHRQLLQLRSANYLILDRFWDGDTCAQVVSILDRHCSAVQPWYVFPHQPEDALLWKLMARTDVVKAAEQYLGTTDILLAGSHFQKRVQGDALDVDQAFHSDQGNNSLLVEPEGGDFGYFIMLSYWTDVRDGDGPTVIRRPGPGSEPEEEPLLLERGSVLLYNLNLLHRGSSMRNPAARRFASWFIFRPAAANWSGQTWHADKGSQPGMIQFLEQATPRQRNLLGIPLPGHSYWTRDIIERVLDRYPHWDMTPYREALTR